MLILREVFKRSHCLYELHFFMNLSSLPSRPAYIVINERFDRFCSLEQQNSWILLHFLWCSLKTKTKPYWNVPHHWVSCLSLWTGMSQSQLGVPEYLFGSAFRYSSQHRFQCPVVHPVPSRSSYGAPSSLYVETLQADLVLNSLSIWVIPSHSAHDAVWMFDVEPQQGPGLHSKLPSPTAFLKHVYHWRSICW